MLVFQKKKPLLLFALTILNTFSIVNAAVPIDLPTVVVNPRSAKKISTITNQTLLDQKQLKASKATDIVAPLYGSPSVNVTQSKSSGTTSLTVRGASGGQGLVTFDGVPLFANLAGFYSLRHFPIDVVESVQINRGFDQAMTSSRTLGGSINLHSRQIRNDVSTLRLETGSNKTLNTSFSTGLGEEDNISLVGGHTQVFEGDSQSSTYSPDADNDNYRMSRVLLRGNKEFSGGQIDASFYYINVNEDSDGPGLTPEYTAAWLDDPNGWFTDEVFITQLKAELDLLENWQSSLQLGYTKDKQNGEVGTFRPIVPIGPFSMNLTSQLILADWQNHHQFSLNNKMNIGVQWGVSTQHQDAETSQNNAHEKHTLISPNIGMSLGSNHWKINASFQQDTNTVYGSHSLYSLGAEWQFLPAFTAWTNYGKKFRAPGVNERLHPIYGNTELKAEHNSGGEIGIRWHYVDSLQISMSTYLHNTHDLVVLALNPNTGATKANNVTEVKTLGVELAIQQKWNEYWQTNLNYTYMDAKNSQTQSVVAVRPKHRINLTSLWQITSGLSWYIELNSHTGFWHDSSNILWTGSVIKLNSALSYQFNENSEIHFRADNLTEDKSIEIYGFDYPRRSFYVGGSIGF